jgi:hypothetical protein
MINYLFTLNIQTREKETLSHKKKKEKIHLSFFNISIHYFHLRLYFPNLHIHHVYIYVVTKKKQNKDLKKMVALVFTSCMNKHETFMSNWAAPGKPCKGANEPINEFGSDMSNIGV